MAGTVPRRMLPIYARVISIVDSGVSLNEIARVLNAEQIPTSRGGRWFASTVRGIRESRAVARGLEREG